MAGTFVVGESKIRPGVYFRVKKKGNNPVPGADDGKVAAFFRADYGPLNKVVPLANGEDYTKIFGTAGGTDIINEAFYGGANTVLAVRVGDATGTAPEYTLKAGGSDAIKLTGLYPGAKAFSIIVREKVSDDTAKEILILSDGRTMESYTFPKGDNDVTDAAAALKKSSLFGVKALLTEGSLDAVTADFTPGTDPGVTNLSFSDGFSAAEKKTFNTAVLDTEDLTTITLLQKFLERLYDIGQFGIGVVAEDPDKVSFEERLKNAAALNSEKMVYVANAAVEEGTKEVKGAAVAARIAGMIASVSSGQSLTHQIITGYNSIVDELTLSQMISAEEKGCLVLAYNSSEQVYIDNAITSLISTDLDDGWKKIRRTKTRFELIRRMNIAADELIGKVNNNKNGRLTVKARLQQVIDKMVSEEKLVEGTVKESESPESDTDYAYYDITVIDLDSIEKLYLTYIFQYSTRV